MIKHYLIVAMLILISGVAFAEGFNSSEVAGAVGDLVNFEAYKTIFKNFFKMSQQSNETALVVAPATAPVVQQQEPMPRAKVSSLLFFFLVIAIVLVVWFLIRFGILTGLAQAFIGGFSAGGLWSWLLLLVFLGLLFWWKLGLT